MDFQSFICIVLLMILRVTLSKVILSGNTQFWDLAKGHTSGLTEIDSMYLSFVVVLCGLR